MIHKTIILFIGGLFIIILLCRAKSVSGRYFSLRTVDSKNKKKVRFKNEEMGELQRVGDWYSLLYIRKTIQSEV